MRSISGPRMAGPTKTELGKLVRDRRVSLKLSLREAAKLARISVATFSRFERGNHPSSVVMERISEALQLEIPQALLDQPRTLRKGNKLFFTTSPEELNTYLAKFEQALVENSEVAGKNATTRLVLEILCIIMKNELEHYSFVIRKFHDYVELELIMVEPSNSQ